MFDYMEFKVKFNLKYGLDKFEDMSKIEFGSMKSESVESIFLLLRKGSISSVSSGISGIEEIYLFKGFVIGVKKDNFGQRIKLEGK